MGGHISQSLNEKIWKSEYIDMSLLFVDSAASVLATAHKDSEVALVLEGNKMFLRPSSSPSGRQRKPDSWDKWASAFHTFMAIYLVRFPSRAIELLKYMEIVRTAAIQFSGYGWRVYDEQFRLKQEAQPDQSWADLDPKLQLTIGACAVGAESGA